MAEVFTDVRLSLVRRDKLLALASVKVADVVWLSGLRVVEGSKGLWVAMPSRKLPSGEYTDIYFPASRAARDELQRLVLGAYKKAVDGQEEPEPQEAA